MKSLTSYNSAVSPQSVARGTQALVLGTCQNGVEFFAPDKSNDPNSTEQQYFYDTGCTQLARDLVRIYQSTGASSETVNVTEKDYAQGSVSPNATRSNAVTITNATFDQNGYPIPANGFDRVETGSLSIAGAQSVNSDYELVMQPVSGGSNQFCADSAGFNVTGIAALGETFGWQGGILSTGTRTVNPDGSVTWNATHSGSTSKGAIGAFSIVTGAQNTACPITTPKFTLAGGTVVGSYSIPTVATYKLGLLVSLSVTGATLANGNTLNITTNSGVAPTSSLFITGIIGNGSTPIATLNVNAFGDGTLTMASAGTVYTVTDWHVVK
jgi:hypothetical protein